jgi:hypothetical protein
MVLVPSFANSLAATNIGLAGIAASASGLTRNAGGRAGGAAVSAIGGAGYSFLGKKLPHNASLAMKSGHYLAQRMKPASADVTAVASRMKPG